LQDRHNYGKLTVFQEDCILNSETIDLIIEKYKSGDTLGSISECVQMSVDRVRLILKKSGVYVKKKQFRCDLDEEQVVSLFKTDHTIYEISEKLGVSITPIKRILGKYDLNTPPIVKYLPYSKYHKLLDKQYILDMFISSKYCKLDLRKLIDCSTDLTTSLLKYHNLHHLVKRAGMVRTLKNRKHDLNEASFKEVYFDNKMTFAETAFHFGISPNYLRKHCELWGIHFRGNTDLRISQEYSDLRKDPEQLRDLVKKYTFFQISALYKCSIDTIQKLVTKHNIEVPAKYSSTQEREIRDWIISKGIVVKNNDRLILKGREVDMALIDRKICIEYCGLYWHTELGGKNHKYHVSKTDSCNEQGYRLITIFEDEYINKRDIVFRKLSSILKLDNTNRIHARKCTVSIITPSEKRRFLETNHIQGNDRSTINLGLFNGEMLVSVMTFSKPSMCRSSKQMMQQENLWELSRFATSVPINGAAGKLLNYFKKNYEWDTIYSYADRRWSEGDVYTKLGFNNVGKTKPNYWYYKSRGKGPKREYRYNFRKQLLIKQGFDGNLTEKEIMEQRGFSRIWDCGHYKFEINKKAT
jgi:predicted HTH domain antitoxin